MEERIRANIKKFREAAGLSQKALGDLAGKGESAIQAYESGKTDIPFSALAAIINALHISLADLERGSREEKLEEKPVMIRVYTQDERLNVASILIKNGYRVRQGKKARTPNGKALDYFLIIDECADSADTSR